MNSSALESYNVLLDPGGSECDGFAHLLLTRSEVMVMQLSNGRTGRCTKLDKLQRSS